MLRSMTAFARESTSSVEADLTWEVRSVNHRYLETVVRLPEELRSLEMTVRERIAARLGRGKIDCSLRLSPNARGRGGLRLDKDYLECLVALGREAAALVGRKAKPNPFELLRWPGVIVEEPPDIGALGGQALELLEQTLASLVLAREREGARLAVLLESRCGALSDAVVGVRERMPQVLAELRGRLVDRLAEVVAELDPNRLEQEMVLLAQRLDVDEEMDRLETHIGAVREAIEASEPVGRRLDFLMQELNREANTLSSKSSDVEVTRLAVEMKVLIEQMREQVQNVE